MNLNHIAKELAEQEGLEEQISIAQIKEVLRILLESYSLESLVLMWMKANKVK